MKDIETRRKKIGTGSKRGTYKWGDKHPWLDDRVFSQYIKSGDKVQEQWTSLGKWEENKEKNRILQHSKTRQKPDLQTGSVRGDFSMSDTHPNHSGYRFIQHYKKDGSTLEYWTTEAKWLDIKARKAEESTRRRAAIGVDEDKQAFPLLYKFRNILNCQHPYAPHTGMFHIDHVRRIADGGRHVEGNLQLATAAWNLSKG
tara:strand:- start:250 stop:849 length:600 start_codon:yes stop_codon:yes gene_type:complete